MGALGFGVDIGGSGIKGAVVDLDVGQLATERYKVLTPQPSTPGAVADVVAGVVGPVRVGGPDRLHVPRRRASRRGQDGRQRRLELDRDEHRVGSGVGHGSARRRCQRRRRGRDSRDQSGERAKMSTGLVIVVTLGTGIGTALFYNGMLVPNSELGHIELDGEDYELKASAGARDREDLPWDKWAKRLQRYFSAIEALLWPDLFIVGGGVSRQAGEVPAL